MNELMVNKLGYHEIVSQAKEWLKECYPQEIEEIEDLSSIETINAIKNQYDGGLDQFLTDGQA